MASALEMLQVTAEEELRKNPDLKINDLKLLRDWLETQKHLPAISDAMLIIFHFSCYYDLERTKECIEKYYTIRTHTPEFFTNRDVTDPELAKSLKVVNFASLPVPDPKGYHISYYGLRDTEPNRFCFPDVCKLVYMSTECAMVTHGTVPGFHVIFDLNGAKLKHLTRFILSVLVKYLQYGEKALPLRRKSIHMVNVVPWIDKLMTLVKPYLHKETFDVLHFHSDGMESLHKHIPKECLPKELGGTLKSVEEYSAENYKTMESLIEYFREDEKIRVDESKRDKKARKQDIVEIQETFKKLDID